jgi:MOSC domain-containing protein YiiM
MPLLLSIQAGLPATRPYKNRDDVWESGIFKAPVDGPVRLNAINLEGDGQADLKNHGGPFRAVLGYGAAHYPAWRDELDMADLPYGAFGENFTITDLTEETVCLGDVYRIGDEVMVQVSQPRSPCWKLAQRWGIKDMADRVHQSNRGGWYHRVMQDGIVEAGMPITLIERPHTQYNIAFIVALQRDWISDPDAALALSEIDALTPTWRRIFYSIAMTEEA